MPLVSGFGGLVSENPATGGGGSWGSITGTLSDQTDLQTALDAKQNTLTNPVTGTGTSGQIAYFSAVSGITSSANLNWDNTNARLGIGTAAPTQSLTLGYQQFNRWTGSGTDATRGIVGYATADQTTNFARVEFFGDRFNVGVFNVQKGGTESTGFWDFRVQNTSVLQIDSAQAIFFGNFFQSGGTNRTIGRYSGSLANFREAYLGEVVCINPVLNTPPRANLDVKATATVAGVSSTAGAVIQAYSGMTNDLVKMLDSAGSVTAAFSTGGAFKPASMADSAAPNGSLYYSTTAAKLVFKDAGGTVNALY